MVVGPGGVGKTELSKTVQRVAQEQGKQVHVVAPARAAACQARGSAIDRFLLANCTAKADSDETWVVVDGASQVSCSKWGELSGSRCSATSS